MEKLWERGAIVRAYDPVARQEARAIYGRRADLVLCESAEDALKGADSLIIVTEWREFRSPDFETIRSILREATIFDGRNLYEPALLRAAGFRYYAIGRGESVAASEVGNLERRSA
jgi:UDPglucose 6-dehydrogenase